MSQIRDKKKPFVSGLIEGSIDTKVYQDIRRTYAKECITFLDFGNVAISNIDPRLISRVEFTECELSPFHFHEKNCDEEESLLFEREGSKSKFSQSKIPISTINKLLINTFSPSRKNHRPYPSAGGLYPVEPIIFLFDEKIEDKSSTVSGAYHFRAISKVLQLLKKMPSEHFFHRLLHNLISEEDTPGFAILYLFHIGKAIFKYRYRGYRHALMEAGSMYQQANTIAQKLGLCTTLWSSFSEQEMLYALDLDHATFMPLTMQLFGYGKHHE